MALTKLRKMKLEVVPVEITIRLDGEDVSVLARPLSANGEKMIQWAPIYIKSRYKPEIMGIPVDSILGAARKVFFSRLTLPNWVPTSAP